MARGKMADLITPVIIGIFGIVAVLVVLAFLLVRQQGGKPRFETKDYYKSYKRNEGYSRGGNPFKQGPVVQDPDEQRAITAAIIGIAVIAILVSIFFDIFEGLLVIFLLPIVVRFIRMRNEANSRRNTARDESRSSLLEQFSRYSIAWFTILLETNLLKCEIDAWTRLRVVL